VCSTGAAAMLYLQHFISQKGNKNTLSANAAKFKLFIAAIFIIPANTLHEIH
jgi:aspartate/glutamate racemase